MADLKKITLLHCNDLHGDFLPVEKDGIEIGGVSLLSGYINEVRNTEENVIFTISGDMFRGSLIDSEFKGISTIEIMNLLAPDVATIGNHEVDYGISHLLFLEKCAKFPIINANVYIKTNHARLFRKHYIMEIDGMKILFIGIITEEVLMQTKQEEYIGTFVDVEEAGIEVGRICDSYQTEDIDFTVLLTHIGFEEDKKLAELLDPKWGVDLIVGGHSHTLLEEPCIVNGIPIVQAGSGSHQIGRFDIVVDTVENCISSYAWKTVPIDSRTSHRDRYLDELIEYYKNATDLKYNRFITRLKKVYTHPVRNRESDLGKLTADILMKRLGVDLMCVASGSLRKKELGPIINYKDLLEFYPYVGEIHRITITGKNLKKAIYHIFRDESFEDGGHTEFYQFSKGLYVKVSLREKKVLELTWKGKSIDDTAVFRIGLQDYHYKNCGAFFALTEEDIHEIEEPRVIATNDLSVIEEYLSLKKLVSVSKEDRWLTVD